MTHRNNFSVILGLILSCADIQKVSAIGKQFRQQQGKREHALSITRIKPFILNAAYEVG